VSSRDVVLARIRSALGPVAPVPTVRAYRRDSDLDEVAVVERFAERVDDYRATVHRADPGGVAATIAAILVAAGARSVVVPEGFPERWLAALGDDVAVACDGGDLPTDDLDRAAAVVTGCAIAIAETGTIVLDGSADQGRRAITLVPDHHVCVVAANRIVATVPEAIALLDPTRPLTMISGPSATSDIELDRVEGVHGPRTLDVVIVGA